ncbi:MAG TPA: hypothetical protein VLJ39_16625 [Tepidisphaeraceae bacterium]|nr:hypothetical protein [Tepidisphaeraceae bacterium]
MTKVTIVAENPASPDAAFRASARDHESVGRTPGAALDELTRQLGDEDSGMLIVVQNFRPDAFFSAAQQARLQDLLALWRAARAGGRPISANERAELESLVGDELDASAGRSEALARELRP